MKKGKKVAVLNMANQFAPGGGYLGGSAAQEEDLCRRTNLVPSLDPQYYNNPCKDTAPENQGIGEFNVLYSDAITVLRQGQDKNYRFMPKKDRFVVSVISSAAYDLNYNDIQKDPKRYKEGMIKKIVMQLETALQHDHHNLVLSAFGCGAFGNDPKIIAALYKEVLAYPRYQKAFSQVVFAIVPSHPADPRDNYKPFKDTLSPDPSWFRRAFNFLKAAQVSSAIASLFRLFVNSGRATRVGLAPTAANAITTYYTAFIGLELVRYARNWMKTAQYAAYEAKTDNQINMLNDAQVTAFDVGQQSAKSTKGQILGLFAWQAYRHPKAFYAGYEAHVNENEALIKKVLAKSKAKL